MLLLNRGSVEMKLTKPVVIADKTIVIADLIGNLFTHRLSYILRLPVEPAMTNGLVNFIRPFWTSH